MWLIASVLAGLAYGSHARELQKPNQLRQDNQHNQHHIFQVGMRSSLRATANLLLALNADVAWTVAGVARSRSLNMGTQDAGMPLATSLNLPLRRAFVSMQSPSTGASSLSNAKFLVQYCHN
mmetsp:Transcript_148972/g.285391  ORF Transcript_148972/g.285391 Transcript_148972/m.285391 type:complete len:122 (-) Transcript_148972:384-749(-)